MTETLAARSFRPDEQRRRILLGYANGEPYGYKRHLRVFAEVSLHTSRGEWETVDHEPITDPAEVSVTFSVEKTWRAEDGWVAGGAMGYDGPASVDQWKCSAQTRAAIDGLIPWHLSAMNAGCAHMIPADTGTVCQWGGFTIGALDNPEPSPMRVDWSDGLVSVGLVRGGPERTLAHYTVNRALVCPVTGYQYGRAWLVRPLSEAVYRMLALCGIAV